MPGASPAYEIFIGSAELLAGLLLVIPATAMLGALIWLIDMAEVFALNMTYDVPVKRRGRIDPAAVSLCSSPITHWYSRLRISNRSEARVT
jgi:hypothetical protein